MEINKIVARFKNGSSLKGTDGNFSPKEPFFFFNQKVAELSKENPVVKKQISYKAIFRNFIIGLSILFFLLSILIIIKALRIPVSNTYYQTTPKKLDPKEHLPKSENILRKPVKEQAGSRALDKEFQSPVFKSEDKLSNKNKESQHKDNKSIIQVKSDKNIDSENKLNEKLNGNDQYASRLVYTVQINSQKRTADAQKQFNFILRSLNEKNLNLLRIEKVGKYYTVRLGKFENYETAKKFLQEINPRLSEAIILKAHVKNERIIKLYEYNEK